MHSPNVSKKFYHKLGAAGMATLTSPESDRAYLQFLTKILPKRGRILDCACGYGRLTIPLAKKGFTIQGIDLSSCLIKAAKSHAKKEGVAVVFKTGNMCKLPYKDDTFDAVICMWSSFNHLLMEKDQLQALKEVMRVTASRGLILIDLPKPISKNDANQLGEFIDPGCRLYRATLAGVENVVYVHDKKSLTQLLKKIENCTYLLKKKSIGKGRIRLIVEIIKL